MDNLFDEDEKMEKSGGKRKKRAVKKVGSKQSKPESFEIALEELEELVSKLDSGDVPLEKSVALFERAQFLAQWCQAKLDKIEGRLKLLIPDGDGGFDAEPIDDFGD